MIDISSFKKSYGQHTVLTIPKLQLDKGIYWIKGPNGSGKSTLFKAISGLIQFEGNCYVNDVSLKNHPVDYRKRVNYSEAEPQFPDFLSLKDLALFVASSKKASSKQLQRLVEVFDVENYFANPVSTYSSGMLKKSGLLLAFLGQPEVIILDEPFITIDQLSTLRLVELILEYHQDRNITFFISTHMDTKDNHLPYDKIYHIENKMIVEQ